MRPTTMSNTLKRLVATKQPVHIESPPGCGKSTIVKRVADELYAADYGYKFSADGKLRTEDGKFVGNRPYFTDVRAVLLDPVDLRGIPTIGPDGRCKWAFPEFLPMSGCGILFIDELRQAPPLVQAALLQLVLDRRLGEYILPEGWTIIAASNRMEDRAGGHRMITALSNRFLHLDLEVHHEDWQDWALRNAIAPEVRAFINARPNMLHKFDPTVNIRAFPTPRSWEFVSTILPACDDETMFDLVAGCVGDGPAAEFMAFTKVYKNLPDIDEWLDDPKKTPPTEPDVLYAACGAIVERVKEDTKLANAAVKIASHIRKEFGVLLFRDLVKVDRSVLTSAAGKEFLRENRDILISSTK